jgi:ABC-type multidrug transport system ATPase subunit
MPGRFSLYMDLSVEENLAFYAGVFGTTVQENYELIRDVYQQIEPFRKRLAGRLSGGMKQKLALSCALIHRPDVLILDEPTTGVDAVSRREFWELLKKIQDEGITILVSTPYMDEAEQCDRVALIQKGRILETSDPSIKAEDPHPLYALRSARGVYRFLELVRGQEGCRSAWLFGDEIHVTLQSARHEKGIRTALEKEAQEPIEWTPIRASIEDRFMELIQGEKNDHQP